MKEKWGKRTADEVDNVNGRREQEELGRCLFEIYS